MKISRCVKETFVVIGKQGSTLDGSNFIENLWKDANLHFSEVEMLAKKDDQGYYAGFWGAMSDLSLSFKPWENNFSKGLYLAGVECYDTLDVPDGWVKWKIPGYEYLVVECEDENTFVETINYMKENNIFLVGAVHDFTCPRIEKNYMYFPIRII